MNGAWEIKRERERERGTNKGEGEIFKICQIFEALYWIILINPVGK